MQDATQDSFHVSPRQEQLWLAEPDGPSERIQFAVDLTGPLDADRLQQALAGLVERHEILRTTFGRRPGIRVPLQIVGGSAAPSWSALELAGLDQDASDERLADAQRDELAAAIDFAQGPLLRALLARLADDRHVLVLTASALVLDASSVGPLLAELLTHYGGAGELVEDPIQYADYAAWQQELRATRDSKEARSAHFFWSDLADPVAPEVPFARQGSSPFVAEELAIELDPATSDALVTAAATAGTTGTTAVQAAWHALLGRISGDEQILVSFVATARTHPDLVGAIGAFIRPLPVRVTVSRAQPFAELVTAVAAATAEAIQRQDYVPDSVSGASISFLAHDGFSVDAGELRCSLRRIELVDRLVWLRLCCEERDGRLAVKLQYDPARLDPDLARALASQLAQVLRSAATPGIAIGELRLLDDAERLRIVTEPNRTAAPIPEQAVHELISARGQAAPDRVAVVDERMQLTYAELEQRANRLANLLRRSGVGVDDVVALAADRSVEMIVGLLGILKAGAAYLPLHYEHPKARLAHQLESSAAKAIVTQREVLAQLPEFAGTVVVLDDEQTAPALAAEPATAPAISVPHDALVYVIYTSGSTGTPKGVGVTHGNLVNYATDIARRLGADAAPLSFGAVSSISTDLGNTSVFGALCSGGTLVLVGPGVAADPAAFARLLERTPVDVIKITPSHIAALLAGGDARVLPRRALVIGGERGPWDLAARVRELAPSLAILNHYGPTEATVGCCTMPVGDGPGPYAPATIPIGGPISNAACYVLDERHQVVPIGVAGTLFIGGAGVARGYIGAPDLTGERFLTDPFAAADGARMYDTGDLVRWLPDSTLEFLGRGDEQLKIRGYRVEPAEVESVLRSYAGVSDAVVVARVDPTAGARLIAYCAVDGSIAADQLHDHAAQWLPEYMLPSAIVTLDQLPRTQSGKVDRQALPEPPAADEAQGEFVAPRTPVEQAVATMWSQTLGLQRIGVHDDFFVLGGHSLLATQVVAQVRSDFAVELPLSSLFTSPTVESLAAEIVKMMGDYDEDTDALLAELEGLSDDEAERLLAGGEGQQ